MRLSVSKIKAFKACRRLYQLKYIEYLEPIVRPEALETGAYYHLLLERINKGDFGALNEGCSKEVAMTNAYYKYIFPRFHVSVAEKWLEYGLGDEDFLVGIVDAISDDGHIVEHKTTGSEITEEYEYGLQWDEQILAYMLMTGMRKVWYTVCRKPTIRQKKGETDEEFYDRMVAWYDEDTESKIRLLEIMRTDDDVERYHSDLALMADEMRIAESVGSFYRNTCHCKQYGRRCEYSSICLHYDPTQEYIEFVKESTDVLPKFAERGF